MIFHLKFVFYDPEIIFQVNKIADTKINYKSDRKYFFSKAWIKQLIFPNSGPDPLFFTMILIIILWEFKMTISFLKNFLFLLY